MGDGRDLKRAAAVLVAIVLRRARSERKEAVDEPDRGLRAGLDG